VFSINIELKVMIGLALLFLLIWPFSEYLLQAEQTMLDSLQQVLSMSA
jgi:flagellar biosynthetic protein FliR